MRKSAKDGKGRRRTGERHLLAFFDQQKIGKVRQNEKKDDKNGKSVMKHSSAYRPTAAAGISCIKI